MSSGKEGSNMLSYWFPAPVSLWWPLAFAIGFAALAIFAFYATRARRAEEPDSNTIATLYVVGLGLAAVSELLMFLDLAFGWSLATAFTLSAGVVTTFAVVAIVVAVLAIGIAVVMQVREEGTYRAGHGYAH
jgi:drug/metabolite transporter (DMT)-like permease